MIKICFVGAGSTIFAKNVLGDCILTPELGEFEISLYDIDKERLEDSRLMLVNINRKYKKIACKIITYNNFAGNSIYLNRFCYIQYSFIVLQLNDLKQALLKFLCCI